MLRDTSDVEDVAGSQSAHCLARSLRPAYLEGISSYPLSSLLVPVQRHEALSALSGHRVVANGMAPI